MDLLKKYSSKQRGIFWMVLQCLGAAVMTTIVGEVSKTLPSTVVVFFRNLFGLMLLLPWFYYYGHNIKKGRHWKLYLARGSFGLLAMQMWFYALTVVPLTLATALSFTSPLISAVLAVLIFKEKGSLPMWLALCAGLVGVLVILRPGTEGFDLNALWVMATAAMWSVSGVIIKSLTRTQSAVAVVFYMGLVMTPLSLPFLLLEWRMPVGQEWLLLIGLGIISNLFQIALAKAIAATDLVHIMPYDFTRLIFVAILAYLFFGETMDVWTLVGAMIILISNIIATRYESRKARRLAANAKL